MDCFGEEEEEDSVAVVFLDRL